MDEAFRKLLTEDSRYPREAYLFVFEALRFAQSRYHSTGGSSIEGISGDQVENPSPMTSPSGTDAPSGTSPRHVTGQQMCEAVRIFALEEYGLLARSVLREWGIRSTHDLGEIVYHLIQLGWMSKTPTDRPEDFDNVFDFDTEFLTSFRF